VLAQLESVQRHGYEIAAETERRSGGVVSFQPASLYPVLYRLERRGLIAGQWVEKPPQRRRRYYRLTAAGRKMLAEERQDWAGDSSSIDLDGTTSVTFNCLGDIAAGKGLSILDYQSSASPDYAFRLLGNFSSDPNFLALLSHTTINGFTARAVFDGTFTDVTPTDVSATPEPATIGLTGLSIAGLSLLLCRYQRRSA